MLRESQHKVFHRDTLAARHGAYEQHRHAKNSQLSVKRTINTHTEEKKPPNDSGQNKIAMTSDHSFPRRRGDPPHQSSHSNIPLLSPPQLSSTSSSSPSPGLIYASPRPSTALGKWCRQLSVVCRLNCILLMRYWKAALLQTIILPLLVVGIVFGVQRAYVSGGGSVTAADNTVTTWTMEGIPQCKVHQISTSAFVLDYELLSLQPSLHMHLTTA